MVSPFDVKSRAASRIDRFSLRLFICALCIGYFSWLFGSLREGLIAGLSLFALILLTLALFERSTLARRDRALRERLGGEIFLQDLILLPGGEATQRVCSALCGALGAKPVGKSALCYAGETYAVRCAQCLSRQCAGEGDVLAAHRARQEAGTTQALLCTTGGFSPGAIRAAEWVDPPVRLLTGAQLAALYGRLHPASDEDIARHVSRQRKPYSFARMRLLALSPAKQKKYLTCSLMLLILYLFTHTAMALFSCLLAFLLALLCKKENSRVFRL